MRIGNILETHCAQCCVLWISNSPALVPRIYPMLRKTSQKNTLLQEEMQQKSRDGDNCLNMMFISGNVNDCEQILQKNEIIKDCMAELVISSLKY